MDVKTQKILELPSVLEKLASNAAFSSSKELALALRPSNEYKEVLQRQRLTTESRRCLDLHPGITIGGAHDVRNQAESARRDAVLDPVDFLDIKSTLIAARNIKRRLSPSTGEFPTLEKIISEIPSIVGLVEAISRVFDERGVILDKASDKLAGIRREMAITKDRLTAKLERILADPKFSPLLQEPLITQRDGRSVIPLKAEFKGKIKSVIHDRSASGATLFVEPLSVVNFNNQVRELQLAERDEIRRILVELSKHVGHSADDIVQMVDALSAIDLGFAKAKYAIEIQATEPVIHHRGESGTANTKLILLSARHPLLEPESVVPISLIFDEQVRALVITGPNTGGKTVALKTVGLLTLMAHAGLHIPTDSGTEIPIFDGVYADIGDEQSIEQSLSTFSGHITNIIRIMKTAKPHSLVLLDELGAGTDPQEGAALAKALLSEFLEMGVMTLVATHYPELKTFAHVTPGVLNASVEFDLESLEPTYHLAVGLPGRSNALAIAERLGLEKSIVEKARESVAPSDLQAESLLDEIHRQRDETRNALAEAQESKQTSERLREDLHQRLKEIDNERREILQVTRAQASQELETFQNEIEDLRQELSLDDLKRVREQVDRIEDSTTPPEEELLLDAGEEVLLQPGDRVLVNSINAEAVITEIAGERVEVQVGRLRVQANRNELTPLGIDEETEGGARDRQHFGTGSRERSSPGFSQPPPVELRLRGMQVDEALEELDRHLDAAYLAGMPFVRVIHGKGTGRLRQAVRQTVRQSAYVDSFESGQPSEGGEGVTIVHLANG
jgi:DNA mismatch repair protein MutS2